MSFVVTPDVLIPRPDTECLIESVTAFIVGAPHEAPIFTMLDLGTGSGVIACALALTHPDINILATDISESALNVAQQNITKHGLTNITLRQSDIYQHITESFDLIVSNPPYLAKDDHHLTGDIRFEPFNALVAEEDGYAILRQIIEGAVTHLNPGGKVCLEHGFEQGAGVRELLMEYKFINISTLKDLSGHDRVTVAQKLYSI